MYVVQAEKFCLLSKGFYAEISEKTMNGIRSRSKYVFGKFWMNDFVGFMIRKFLSNSSHMV